MTQEELAAKVGITQAALSRYENGLRAADDETVSQLASALGVTADFLKHDYRLQGAIAADAHMRRQKTTKPSDWKRVEARLNAARMHSSYLLSRVPIDPSNHVVQTDPDSTTPGEAAALLRASWRMPIGPVRQIVAWVESAGVLVIEEDFGTHRIDGMSQWAGQHAVMLINANLPTDRKRWTVAHELGHLVMHSNYMDVDIEDQANQFATEFLMPEHVIRHQLSGLTLGKLSELKSEWGVSMQALFERAYRLGRVTSEERQQFYRRLNSRGWKTREPGSDQIPPEPPRLARSMGEQLIHSGLSPAEVARLIGVPPNADSPFLPPSRGLRVV